MDMTKLYLGPRGGGLTAVPHHSPNPSQEMVSQVSPESHVVGSNEFPPTPTTPPTEITDFETWLQAYHAACESKETVPHFENLRKVFNAENDALDELYKPLQNFTDEILKRDFQNRGMRLYGEWGRTKRKEFLLSYYDNEFFRAQYARNRFQNSARSFLQALALRILPQSPPVENFLPKVSRVISIGVGPASDVAGFLAYLRTRGMDQKLTYFVLDQCTQWDEYIRICDRHWAGKYKVSLWFKNARIVNMESLNLLPDADMIVFSFSNTALMEPSIWPVLQRRYPLIIVLDGIKEILLDSFLECQFQKFQLNEKTNLYYTFNDPHERTTEDSSPTVLKTDESVEPSISDSPPNVVASSIESHPVNKGSS